MTKNEAIKRCKVAVKLSIYFGAIDCCSVGYMVLVSALEEECTADNINASAVAILRTLSESIRDRLNWSPSAEFCNKIAVMDDYESMVEIVIDAVSNAPNVTPYNVGQINRVIDSVK